ncbi:hypothetical protein [Citrobacter amalonaticus]|uniref:hypothetical protein n=1 Tax=Citrobacter amalonaticus TaxID=35703 RepID=UPI0028C1AF97|nr:hypothetical protein [Citrobacter amalonaticus]MDT7068977.1 hypothetical protein [Citrobacter amalonaticus]
MAHNILKKLTYFLLLIAGIWCLYYPISKYLEFFPGNFSTDINKWSTFGTYIGGIYGPIFSFASVVVLVMTLLEINKFNRKSLDLSQRGASLSQILKLIEIMDLAMSKNHLLGNNRKENYKWLGDAVKHVFRELPPEDENEIRDASISRFKDDDVGTLYDEMAILKEILTRIQISDDEELKETAMAALRAMIPNDERYWLECFANRFHPDIKLLINVGPQPFSGVPPYLKRLIEKSTN